MAFAILFSSQLSACSFDLDAFAWHASVYCWTMWAQLAVMPPLVHTFDNCKFNKMVVVEKKGQTKFQPPQIVLEIIYLPNNYRIFFPCNNIKVIAVINMWPLRYNCRVFVISVCRRNSRYIFHIAVDRHHVFSMRNESQLIYCLHFQIAICWYTRHSSKYFIQFFFTAMAVPRTTLMKIYIVHSVST